MVLTGAGISVASGLRPFRGPGGWWTDDPQAQINALSPDLVNQPERIWQIYGPMRRQIREAEPNAAHLFLAKMQRESGCDIRIVTQNVDGLHQKAGSTGVVELHGSMRRSRCSNCNLPPFDDPNGEARPCPDCGQLLRPDIVLFGERIPEQADIQSFGAVMRCDYFLAVGTSGNVKPANAFVQRADSYGAMTIIVNLEPLDPPNLAFQSQILGKAEDILPQMFTWQNLSTT